MANLIDSKSILSCESSFKSRSLNVLELMESIFGPVPINCVYIELPFFNENWPRFINFSDVKTTVISLLVPCILSSVIMKPTGVLNLFCDHRNLAWERVKIIPSRPLTNVTKGPE